MGRIIISENVSLDGVVQDPTGQEGFARGGWFHRISDRDREAWARLGLEEARGAAVLLLGRRSDEWFAPRWLSRGGAWADRLNGMPKYVVSSTRREAAWSNATILGGDVVAEVTKLKARVGGDVVVYASIQLVRALIEHGLADELRLVLFPVVLGAGERLFAGTGEPSRPRLVGNRIVGDSLVHLAYRW